MRGKLALTKYIYGKEQAEAFKIKEQQLGPTKPPKPNNTKILIGWWYSLDWFLRICPWRKKKQTFIRLCLKSYIIYILYLQLLPRFFVYFVKKTWHVKCSIFWVIDHVEAKKLKYDLNIPWTSKQSFKSNIHLKSIWNAFKCWRLKLFPSFQFGGKTSKSAINSRLTHTTHET